MSIGGPRTAGVATRRCYGRALAHGSNGLLLRDQAEDNGTKVDGPYTSREGTAANVPS
ncbi:hypothetical protein [Blastococcus deserti]|uniref:Uncharacterized protein n=1 Tax=Blastococcus deserti TaxID=2259033 RepID=A0ABW4XB62_9ACTN